MEKGRADLAKTLSVFRSYGLKKLDGEYYFKTGQFDRCDPPNPYIEDVNFSADEYGNVSVAMTADAWAQFLWMAECKGVDSLPKIEVELSDEHGEPIHVL